MHARRQRAEDYGRRRGALVRLAGVALLAAALGIARTARAQDIGFRLIVNEANPVTSLALEQVGKIFLREVTAWDGGLAVTPVDQPGGARVRAVFSDAVLARAASAVVSYWRQQIFSGRGVPPVEKRGDAEVIEYVRAHPGAIGYVTPAAATAGVRVIEVVRVIRVR